MPEHTKTILCTRPVSDAAIESAALQNILIDVLSFIETTPLETVEVQQEIELAANEIATIIFTSMNAVDVVISMLDDYVPEWSIYCIGHKTKELAETYFGKDCIAGTADNAAELADKIIEDGATDEVIFFCGNQRRDELPAKLQKYRIGVNEVVVYQTEYIKYKVDKVYDGILFFSPSAAESFFMQNNLAEQTIVFAIGQTTKTTIEKYCSNKIIVSKQPGKDHLVEMAVDFFVKVE